jgi:hypothetical protein
VAGFVRHPLQRNVWHGIKKLANIQGLPVFCRAGFEKFHYTE